WEQVARRARLLASHDDDVGEDLLERLGRLGVDGGLAPEDGAQEPAGAVHAEEAHRAVARAPLRRADLKTCEELSAEGPGHVVDRPALLRDGLGELGA